MADNKKTKKEEKIIPKEELKKFRDWYRPSNIEKMLLSRIIFEIDNILSSKKINGQIRWGNEIKAFISIPYGDMAKIEVICDKTFSIPIFCTFDVDNKVVNVVASILGETKTFIINDMVIKHGYIDHEGRTFKPNFEEVEVQYEPKMDKNDIKDIHFSKTQPKRENKEYGNNIPGYMYPMIFGCDCD